MGASTLEVGDDQRIQLGIERFGAGDGRLGCLTGADVAPGDRIGKPDGVEPCEFVRSVDLHQADSLSG